MHLVFIGGALVILIICVWLWWRILQRKRALRLFMKRSQQLTDHVVTLMAQQLGWVKEGDIHSDPVADVWGHGILAFEYHLKTPKQPITKAAITTALSAVAEKESIASSDPRYAAFVVTDFWQRDGQTHFDVAFVTNTATIEYVQDLNRV